MKKQQGGFASENDARKRKREIGFEKEMVVAEYRGINYFPLSTNFFEKDLQELLDAKFGIKGPYAVLKLLCKIYADGYYISWGEDQCLIFARKLGAEFSFNDVDQIVTFLLNKGFFDKESYEKHQILTSAALQQVWIEATKRRKRDLTKLPYLLIDTNTHKTDNNKPENVDKQSTQQPLNLENADIFRQSKVKESKRKNYPPSIPPLRLTRNDDSFFALSFGTAYHKFAPNNLINRAYNST